MTVRGRGRGGRNQEVSLGAALALDGASGAEGVLVASFGTDGVDGPTDAAGGIPPEVSARALLCPGGT